MKKVGIVTKKAAIEFFGNVNLTADACGRSAQAIDKWPRVLSDSQTGLVVVAAIEKYGWTSARRAFGLLPGKP